MHKHLQISAIQILSLLVVQNLCPRMKAAADMTATVTVGLTRTQAGWFTWSGLKMAAAALPRVTP